MVEADPEISSPVLGWDLWPWQKDRDLSAAPWDGYTGEAEARVKGEGSVFTPYLHWLLSSHLVRWGHELPQWGQAVDLAQFQVRTLESHSSLKKKM